MDVDEPEYDDVEYVREFEDGGNCYAAWRETGESTQPYKAPRIRVRLWGYDAYAKEGGGMATVEDEIKPLYDACYALFCRKQANYGSTNIEAFGDVGVLVRLSDKLARLKHLLAQGVSPNNEAIEDTWQDIANCGVIGLALARGVGFHPRERYRLLRRMDDVEDRK